MQIDHIDGSFRLDPSSTLNMQNMYDTVSVNFPKGNQRVVGLEFPLIGWYCNTSGLINPLIDIKETISRMFSYGGIDILKIVFDKLLALLQALGGAFLDTKLPVLELSVRGLFRQDIYTTLTQIVTRLYDSAKDTLMKILNALGITFPLLDSVINKAKEIAMLVKSIVDGLVREVIKKIKQIIDLITAALKIYTAYNQGTLWTLVTWENAIKAFLNEVLNYFINPPTLNDLVGLVKKLAAEIYGVAKATYAQLVAIIEKFKLPIFGSPLDWKLPLSNVKIPNIDFYKIMTDMVAWLNNFVVNLIKKFIDAVLSVLRFFGLGFDWLAVNLPIKFCVVNVNDIKPKAA